MKTRIVNISIRQSSNFVAILYFVISLPFVLVFAGIALAKGDGFGVAAFVVCLIPLIYCIGAYIGTAFLAWIYNIVAKQVGGIEFTTAEVAEPGRPGV